MQRAHADHLGFGDKTAKTRPTKLRQPFTHWSVRKLADYLATKRGRKVMVGRERLRQILIAEGITHKHRERRGGVTADISETIIRPGRAQVKIAHTDGGHQVRCHGGRVSCEPLC